MEPRLVIIGTPRNASWSQEARATTGSTCCIVHTDSSENTCQKRIRLNCEASSPLHQCGREGGEVVDKALSCAGSIPRLNAKSNLQHLLLQETTTDKVRKFRTTKKDEVKSSDTRQSTDKSRDGPYREKGQTPKHLQVLRERRLCGLGHLDKRGVGKAGHFHKRATFVDAQFTFFRPPKYDIPETRNISQPRQKQKTIVSTTSIEEHLFT